MYCSYCANHIAMYKAEPVITQMHMCLITLAAFIKSFISLLKNLYGKKLFSYSKKLFCTVKNYFRTIKNYFESMTLLISAFLVSINTSNLSASSFASSSPWSNTLKISIAFSPLVSLSAKAISSSSVNLFFFIR